MAEPTFETRAELEAWAAMDEWCRKRLATLTERTTPMVMSGIDLDDREFRRLLGQHQAYLHMRSFITGARRVTLAHMHLGEG